MRRPSPPAPVRMIPLFVRRGHRERDGTILPGRHLRGRRRRRAPPGRGRALKSGRQHPEDHPDYDPETGNPVDPEKAPMPLLMAGSVALPAYGR